MEAHSAFRVESTSEPGGPTAVRVTGRITVFDAAALRDALVRAIGAGGAARIDLGGVASADGGAAAALVETAHVLERRGAKVELFGAPPALAPLIDLFLSQHARATEKPPPARIGTLDQVGRVTAALVEQMRDILDYLGNVIVALGGALRAPRSLHWADVGPIAERAGADGLPIVLTLCFLLGLILAFQAAIQLRQFGADIYVADGVALSVTRELGPLMVAITVAGRSGAAFAAELGTMKVSEEVDALRTIGICPYRYLVFPRLLALVLVVPLLTLMGDLIAYIQCLNF